MSDVQNPVTVVGCGFVGSLFTREFLPHTFAGVLPLDFRFIDDDTWEERNAANQQVDLLTAAAGEPKAETMAKLALSFRRLADWQQTRLTAKNADALLGGSWIIVDAVDNHATRTLLYEYGMDHKIPVLHLGITEMGTGSVEWSYPGHDRWHLAPHQRLGKGAVKDPTSGVTPPCELAAMRACGWATSHAAAIAASLYFGFDPYGFQPGLKGERGWLSLFRITSKGGFDAVPELWSRIDVEEAEVAVAVAVEG
jgi:molybdopterin/thiamine biosynthesis adenylyltransferase